MLIVLFVQKQKTIAREKTVFSRSVLHSEYRFNEN